MCPEPCHYRQTPFIQHRQQSGTEIQRRAIMPWRQTPCTLWSGWFLMVWRLLLWRKRPRQAAKNTVVSAPAHDLEVLDAEPDAVSGRGSASPGPVAFYTEDELPKRVARNASTSQPPHGKRSWGHHVVEGPPGCRDGASPGRRPLHVFEQLRQPTSRVSSPRLGTRFCCGRGVLAQQGHGPRRYRICECASGRIE